MKWKERLRGKGHLVMYGGTLLFIVVMVGASVGIARYQKQATTPQAWMRVARFQPDAYAAGTAAGAQKYPENADGSPKITTRLYYRPLRCGNGRTFNNTSGNAGGGSRTDAYNNTLADAVYSFRLWNASEVRVNYELVKLADANDPKLTPQVPADPHNVPNTAYAAHTVTPALSGEMNRTMAQASLFSITLKKPPSGYFTSRTNNAASNTTYDMSNKAIMPLVTIRVVQID
jgi:hypothetical protein